MDNGYFNHVRPISPTGTVDSRSRDGPNPESPFIFGRTPSLRLEIPSLSPLPIPFPHAGSTLERRTSSLSHHSTSSTTSAQIIAPPARPYQLPPGLADSPLPSALDVKAGLRGSSRLARGPKIDNEPPIPLEIQHLLLTTPPPPRFNATSVAFASMSYPPSVPADWEEPREKMPTLLKRIRALTLRSRKEEHEVVVPARLTQPRQEVLDLKKSAQRKVETGTISDGIPRSWKAYETLYAAVRLGLSLQSPLRRDLIRAGECNRAGSTLRNRHFLRFKLQLIRRSSLRLPYQNAPVLSHRSRLTIYPTSQRHYIFHDCPRFVSA